MNEGLLEYLSARNYAYRLLQRLLGAVPAADLFACIDGEIAVEAFEIVSEAAGKDAGAADLACVLSAVADTLAGGEEALDAKVSEYNRLFVGPFDLPVPPFESVIRDRRRILLTATTLEVRRYYQASGFEPQLLHHVADDHVALELDFLAALGQRALDCAMAEDETTAKEYLKASRNFLQAHLAVWVGDFAAQMAEKVGKSFYTTVAAATAAFVAADLAALEQALQ